MLALQIALLSLAAIGHVIIWVALANRIHAYAIPDLAIRLLTAGCWVGLIAIPLVLWQVAAGRPATLLEGLALVYLVPCAALTLYAVGVRADEIIHRRDRARVLLENRETPHDLSAALGHRPVEGRVADWLTRLPGNEALLLHVDRKRLRMARFPEGLSGLSIAHLSDLHMSRRIGRAWFEAVVGLTNELAPDIIAITGDLFDHADCLEWIGETLGRLRAPLGVYFVLGNHDLRIDSDRARERLVEAGMIDLGGRWLEVTQGTHRLVLAGNELPWFPPAADMRGAPTTAEDGAHLPRVLLAHAPEQLRWARRHDFDLMLAGHTHGGQIRFPVLGPVVAPSRLGTKFAAGTFHHPPTVLHVSRGISSFVPLRYNCPPELALLVLEGPSAEPRRDDPATRNVGSV